MDVSRISAISPRQIDWRRLTAREIIKYEQQGIEVPNQYLQWAHEFINSIENDDQTTYEMAVSASSNNQNNPTQTTTQETTEQSEESDSQVQELNNAQTLRQNLTQDGKGLYEQGLIFMSESLERSRGISQTAQQLSTIESNSINKSADLTSQIEEILSSAETMQNEFKTQVEQINKGTDNNSTFAKMNRLQEELERYGYEGLQQISSAQNDFNQYQTTIESKIDSVVDAKDFGTETIQIGSQLSRTAWRFFAPIIEMTGNHTVTKSDKAFEKIDQLSGLNIENFNAADEFKTDIKDKTGVESQKAQMDNGTNDNDNDNDKPDEVNKTDPAYSNGNIDEILQYKIRKGEDINPPV